MSVFSPFSLIFWSELGARLMMADLDGSNQVVISHERTQIGEKPRALTYRPEGNDNTLSLSYIPWYICSYFCAKINV